MKIKVLKRAIKAIKTFEKKEWPMADLENFGKKTKWKKEKYRILALDDNNHIIGSLRLKIQAGVAHIGTILVTNSKRKQGIGKNLTLKAEETSKKLNAHKIYLITGDNWKAVNFYKSLGYKLTGNFKNHYFNQDFLIFTKFL